VLTQACEMIVTPVTYSQFQALKIFWLNHDRVIWPFMCISRMLTQGLNFIINLHFVNMTLNSTRFVGLQICAVGK